MRTHCLQERERPHDVGPQERFRIGEGIVVVAFGSKVHDCVGTRDKIVDQRLVGNVAVNKRDPVLDGRKGLAISGVGQSVENRDFHVGTSRHRLMNEIGTDEAGTPGDQ